MFLNIHAPIRVYFKYRLKQVVGKKVSKERRVKKYPVIPQLIPKGETQWGVQHVAAIAASILKNLYNPEFYLLVYKNIYANSGGMMLGIDGTAVDCISLGGLTKSLRH